MQYLGSIHWLQVTSVKPTTVNAGSCHDGLSLDMSNMSLDVDCPIDSDHDTAETAEFCADYNNFFIITHCSHIIMQTTSSVVVSCSYSNCVKTNGSCFKPRITLDSIRGMDKQVKLLYEIVVIPLSAPDAFKSRGMSIIQPQIATTTCFVVPAQVLICPEDYCFMESRG